MSLVDAQVSVFAGVRTTVPVEQLPLGAMLARIQDGTYQPEIDALRALRAQDQAAYKKKKTILYGFTPGCALRTRAKDVAWKDKLIAPSQLIHLDVDDVDASFLKARLTVEPSVVFAFISPSGEGLKLGIASEGIVDTTTYNQIWRATIEAWKARFPDAVFKEDEHVKFLNALCFVSHDPAVYVNPAAVPFAMPPPTPKPPRKPRPRSSPGTGGSDEALAQEALRYIPADDYEIWLAVGMALHSTGWPSRRTLWDTWSQTSQKYEERTQESKWADFIEEGGRTIATMFDLAKKYGYRPPRKEKATLKGSRRPAVPDMTGTAVDAGAPPLPAEDDTADLLTRVEDEEDIDGLAQLARQDDDETHDLTRRYRATRVGLMWSKPTKDGPSDVLLTNFCAHIIGQITEDDGAETRLHFDMSATRGAVSHTFRIPATQFAGMGWVTEQLGAEAIVLPGMTIKDHARTAIQILSPTIERRHIYTHIGWRQLATGWAYLHAGGAVGAEGLLADVAVEPGNALAPYVLHVPETPADGQAALLASMQMLTVAPPHIVVPLYGALWRALLGTCDLSVHLTGDTGMGKSELAALVQQHQGKAMNAKNLPASWTSTANALEVLAFQAKDAILVIDDFCPRGSPAEVSQLHAKADRVLRAQGNRSARQRLDRTGRERPAKPPRGLIVSTGEDIPQGQSLRARICILEVTPATVDWPRLSPCQKDAAAGLYTQAMAAFVQWLAPHYDDVIKTLPQDLITLRAAAVQTAHRRTPELIANLALGWRYFLACAHDCGVLSAAECDEFWGWAWRTLGEVGSAQQAHQADDDPVARFLALLRGAITAGHAHVQDARTYEHPPQAQDWGWSVRDITSTRPDDASQVWTPHGSCIGYLDDVRLYLEPEASYSIVQRMAEMQRAPLALTQRTLHKRMAERGLLIRQPSQTHHTVSKRLGPSQNLKRVLDIAVSSLVPLYSATGGNFGNNGNGEAQEQPNQDVALLPVPPWSPPEVVTRGKKVVTSPANSDTADPIAAGSVTTSVTTNFGDVTTNFGELSPQLIEKKDMLLKLPKLPLPAQQRGTREEESSRASVTLTDEVTI